MTKVATIGTRRRLTPAEQSRMRTLLHKHCYSDAELAEVIKAPVRVVAAWRRKEQCYVEAWTHDSRGRLFTPRWRLGNKPNAERPGPRETAAERMARLRAERRQA